MSSETSNNLKFYLGPNVFLSVFGSHCCFTSSKTFQNNFNKTIFVTESFFVYIFDNEFSRKVKNKSKVKLTIM